MPGITQIVAAISADVNARRVRHNMMPLVDGHIVIGAVRHDEWSAPPRVTLVPKSSRFEARKQPNRSNLPGSPQNQGAGLRSVLVTSFGGGYTTAAVSFSAPDIAGGTLPTATAVLISGSVVACALTSLGSGYTKPPVVTIAGDGTDAEAVAYLSPPAEKLLQLAQRSVFTDVTLFECHCWDVQQPPHEDFDFDVAQLLYQQVISSAHRVAPGAVLPTPGKWLDSMPHSTQMLAYGRYYVFGLEFETPVLDEPLLYVKPPVTPVVTTYLVPPGGGTPEQG